MVYISYERTNDVIIILSEFSASKVLMLEGIENLST